MASSSSRAVSLWRHVVMGLASGEVLCLRLIVMRCWCGFAWWVVAALGMCYVACFPLPFRARFGFALGKLALLKVCARPEASTVERTEGVAMSPKTPNLGHDRQRNAGKPRENPHWSDDQGLKLIRAFQKSKQGSFRVVAKEGRSKFSPNGPKKPRSGAAGRSPSSLPSARKQARSANKMNF